MSKKAAAAPVGRQQKYEKKEMPDADTLGLTFVEIADEVAALSKERKELDEQIKARNSILKEMMEDEDNSKSWSVRGDGYSVSYVRPAPRKTLVKELLIQAGVSIKQIEKGTKETPVTPFVTVRLAGEED